MPSSINEMLRVCPGLRGELLIMVSDALGAEIDVAHLQEINMKVSIWSGWRDTATSTN
jgi:hypothetical protein